MHFLFCNELGFGIAAAGFATAFGVGHFFGIADEGPLMVLSAPVIVALDLGYRWWSQRKSAGAAPSAEESAPTTHFFVADRGGRMFFLPIWQVGVFWLALGIYYCLAK